MSSEPNSYLTWIALVGSFASIISILANLFQYRVRKIKDKNHTRIVDSAVATLQEIKRNVSEGIDGESHQRVARLERISDQTDALLNQLEHKKNR